MAGLSAQEELILLRKRARRRLVGAVVLVLVATLILWKVVGRVPEQQMRPESVLVVGVASAPVQAGAHPASAPLVASAPAEASVADATALPESLSTLSKPVAPARPEHTDGSAAAAHPATAAPAPAAHPAPAVAPAPARDKKPEPQPARPAPHKKPDPAAILEGHFDSVDAPAPVTARHERYLIQLAALSDPAKADALRSRLSGLGVQASFSKVKTSKGQVTRVRVGPFSSREEANVVLRKLARAGESGIIVGVPAP
jgi:DedD protein